MTAISRSRTVSSLSRQRGSTLTGLIIGLIVGLGIAVAVALTITKGASPFTDKTAKAGRPADPAPGQTIDPNKPMYSSRDAARSANKEIASKAASRDSRANSDAGSNSGSGNVNLNNDTHVADRDTHAPDVHVPERAEHVDRAPAPSKPSAADADPLGQVLASLKERNGAKADTHAAPAAAPAATGPLGEYVYYLQAGAFREISDAEATRAKLALLGFEAAISDRSSDSGVLHRVRMGPYNQVESMNKARAKLLDSGVDVAIVRNQR